MNQFFAIGLKVLAAAGVGVAVYFGIDKAVSGNKNRSNAGPGVNNNPTNSPMPSNEGDYQSQVGDSNTVASQPSSGEKVVSGLRVAQDVLGRAFSLCQNLTMAADNIVRIFGGNDQNYGQNYGQNRPEYGGYYNDPYRNGYQDKYKDPPGYRRLSPFILEYVGGPVDSRNYYNNYPTNGGY